MNNYETALPKSIRYYLDKGDMWIVEEYDYHYTYAEALHNSKPKWTEIKRISNKDFSEDDLIKWIKQYKEERDWTPEYKYV
jgi:hypothetical protein